MSLISTSDLRSWLGIAEGDRAPNAKLATIASAIEDFCDSYTNRKLEAARYSTDPYFCYLDGTGRANIHLPLYPVSYVSEVNIDSNRTFDTSTQLASTDFFFYPEGKLISEAGFFTRGRRNIRVDFIAGYAPIVGGTHNMAVSTYPIPQDLKQVMVEMCVESFKEGMTAVHTVSAGPEGEPKFIQMLSRNGFWKQTLIKYKRFDIGLMSREE
jgi:hypothetical protein